MSQVRVLQHPPLFVLLRETTPWQASIMSASIKSKFIWWLTASAILFYCLDYFFRLAPGLVVQQLMHQYDTTASGVALFASLFYFGYVLMQFPIGVLFDKFGIRNVLIVTILICMISFIIFVFGRSYLLAIWLRWLIGAVSAASFIGVLYIAKHFFPKRYFALIASLTIALGTVLASLLQFMSAEFLKYLPWHMVFLLISSVGLLSLTIIYLLQDLREKHFSFLIF
ncbi:MAG: MFS transporter [Gammaproteobacteria bacterium]|nr:MFS transporter [Gammaproteobacteria bacterium]